MAWTGTLPTGPSDTRWVPPPPRPPLASAEDIARNFVRGGKSSYPRQGTPAKRKPSLGIVGGNRMLLPEQRQLQSGQISWAGLSPNLQNLINSRAWRWGGRRY